MEQFGRSLRFALRQLRRDSGFTLAVVVTLALAIGANTAIFSVLNALLLKSLPYPNPERIATIYARVTGGHASDERAGIDGERWELLRDHVPAVIAAASSGMSSGVNLRAGARVEYLHAARVSAHYFEVLGLNPIAGRGFSEEEDRPHGPRAAILTYALWRSAWGGEASAIGKSIVESRTTATEQPVRSIVLKGEPYTVVGVLPEKATTPLQADVYTPLQPSREGEGGGTNYQAIVRLRDGTTWQQADAEINRAWSPEQRGMARSRGVRVSYYAVPLQKAQTDALGPRVMALMAAAGMILLIACANLGGLALVRALSRRSEIATRLALGAGRWQVQSQFWTENLVLALAGGAAGIGVGYVALRGLMLLLPEHFLPVASVTLDGRVLAFTAIVSLLTSVLFGMIPAFAARQVDVRSSMGTRGAVDRGSGQLRQTLVAGEVAITVVLLAGAGLLIRTLMHLETLSPGFEAEGVMVAKASLDDARFHDAGSFRKLLEESTAAMRHIPGVESAAVGLSLPWERALNDGVTLRDGKQAGRQDGTDVVYVTPGYFETLRMRLLAGRLLTDADGACLTRTTEHQTPCALNAQHVAVVNRAFARRFYGGANPVGHYVNTDTLIVGEVADVAVSSGLYEGAPLMSEQTMYVPAAQMNAQTLPMIHVWFQPDWIVRTRGRVDGMTGEMQRALASVDPNLPFSGFYRMKDLLAGTLSMQRIEVALLGTMAALALILSAVGLFALVANTVVQRTREIGIRMALGSTVGEAVARVGRSGAAAAGVGLAIGLVLSAGALRVMRSVLYGVGIYDAQTIAAVVLMIGVVSFIATMAPALRARAIDPAQALRNE